MKITNILKTVIAVIVIIVIGVSLHYYFNKNSDSTNYSEQKIMLGENSYNLKIYYVPTDKDTHIMEVTNVGKKGTIIVKIGRSLFQSIDNGKSWTKLFPELKIPDTHWIARVFTMKNGHKLLFVEDKLYKRENNMIYEIDKKGTILAKTPISVYPWAFPNGIDEDNRGNVIFAENKYAKYEEQIPTDEISVYKRTAVGKYKKVLTKEATLDKTDESAIRNFGYCKVNPNNHRQWLVSSYGSSKQNKLFASQNNGETFNEVQTNQIQDLRIKASHNILGFRNLSNTTDGKLISFKNNLVKKGYASIVAMNIKNKKVSCNILNTFNEEREVIDLFRVGNNLYLFPIKSEDFVEFYLFAYKEDFYTAVKVMYTNKEGIGNCRLMKPAFSINNSVYIKIKTSDGSYKLAKIDVK